MFEKSRENKGHKPSGGEIKDAREMAARRAEELLKKVSAEESNKPDAAAPSSEKAGISKADYEQMAAQLREWMEIKDRLLRQAAEFENAKKRLQREKEEFLKFAHQRFVSELLPILRGLDRVIHHGAAPNGVKDPLVEGVELVIKQIGRVLEAHGVKRVETVGKMFDPHVHEAVAHINSDRPEETIIEETEPGFLLHDRLIHPAKVIVSKGPPESGNKDSVSKSGEAPMAEAEENESTGS